APAIAGGFVGVAGAVGVTIMNVTTKAYIGNNSSVNLADPVLGISKQPGQSVNVTGVDQFKSLTFAGGLAAGFVGVGAGVDIGGADSTVKAFIGAGSVVHAAADVEVNALSHKDVMTLAVAVGAGFVGVALSVSVWMVGTTKSSEYNDGAGGPDK